MRVPHRNGAGAAGGYEYQPYRQMQQLEENYKNSEYLLKSMKTVKAD
jgi:hypothetical protein